jgi:hypothetical protein
VKGPTGRPVNNDRREARFGSEKICAGEGARNDSHSCAIRPHRLRLTQRRLKPHVMA